MKKTRPTGSKGSIKKRVSLKTPTGDKPHHSKKDAMIHVAVARFAGYGTAAKKLTPFSTLREQCLASFGFSPSVVTMSRYIADAFRNGWVKVEPAVGLAPALKWHPNHDLAAKVKLKFKSLGLRDAIVINVEANPNRNVANPDDPFYQALGQATAEYIASGFVRDKDILGLGSGRAVYNAVKFLERYAPLNIKDLKLMSLTGAVWSRANHHNRVSWLDADMHVAMLLLHCPSAKPWYMTHALTYPALIQHLPKVDAPKAANEVVGVDRRENTLLGDKNWREFHPSVALLGVGTVHSGIGGAHRFWVSSDTPRESLDPLLHPVYEDLKALVSLFEKDVLPDYSPVADTANHLFFVPHPDVKIRQRFQSKELEIRNAIAAVNDKLLSIQDKQFHDVTNIALVAGGDDKVYAIGELLANPDYNVAMLCTDSVTADKLLKTY